ncbi:MAG: hypothetical protein JOY68_05835 [Candidatus Dormibacteraeota bacterium]|nr:hypothetical protein [Candidatus Dormibacteraeota bacterium]
MELVDPPGSISVDLDSIASATVPVTIRISNLPPPGFVIAGQTASPSSVVVTGPQHELPGISVVVAVDLANRKTNLEQDFVPLLYDSHGNPVTDASALPNLIAVAITVNSAEATRAVAVNPDLVGTPGGSNFLSGEAALPLTVLLTGPQDLLNSINSVSTSPIFLGGRFGTDVVSVTLQLPPGVTAFPSSVTVTLFIKTLPTPSPSATPSPSPTAP